MKYNKHWMFIVKYNKVIKLRLTDFEVSKLPRRFENNNKKNI